MPHLDHTYKWIKILDSRILEPEDLHSATFWRVHYETFTFSLNFNKFIESFGFNEIFTILINIRFWFS